MDELWVCHLGLVPYSDGVAVQETLRSSRQAEEVPDTLLLLEHPPTYTRGRRSGAEDLPFDDRHYRNKGIDVFDTDRGGQVTYHGPGQLVGYPIMRIDDVHRYLRTMEDAIIAALADAGVHARTRHDEGIAYTGVWVEDRKIASIGVHVSRGVTTHGFAVNVENDLDPFSRVVACGLPDVTMTSLARELERGGSPDGAGSSSAVPAGAGASTSSAVPAEAATLGAPANATVCDPLLTCTRKRIAYAFSKAHGRRQRLVSPQRLGIDTANPSRLAERVPIRTTQPAPVAPRASRQPIPA
jgi:lipoyl(octanoyl) transferase